MPPADRRGAIAAEKLVCGIKRGGRARERTQPDNVAGERSWVSHPLAIIGERVIAHEDIDVIAALHVVPFVAAAVAQSKARYGKHIGEARLIVGNIIRLLCRAPKSRAGRHFAAAIGLRSLLEDFAPEMPDYALDQHTLAGKKLGRGLDHFREVGAFARAAADRARPLRG